MLLTSLFGPVNIFEAKARIEHPEDLIFDQGLKGAASALQILQTTAARPQSVSVKFDGSPSLIMGWRGNDFVLTDKAGFSAKGYDGMTTSSEAIERMIAGRKVKDTSDAAQAARRNYAKTIAGLYPILKQAVPRTFKGFAQGDLLWTSTPPVRDGAYEFQPVKILYRVPENSELGEKIGQSQVGMVIHSVYSSQEDQEPEALRNVAELGFKEEGGLVILPHELDLDATFGLDRWSLELAQKLLKSKGKQIAEFLDPVVLADRDLKALPGAMKSFVAWKSGQGSDDFSQAPQEFLAWLGTPASKITSKMAERATAHIRDHLVGYNAVWQFVSLIVGLKMDLKNQIDGQVSGTIQASLRDTAGHEGFVSVTPQGIVKLVNRAEFMKKNESVLMEQEQDDSPTAVWTFMRANPPTLGHRLVADTVADRAQGGDYWIFLSHSQDAKKNPLDWRTKIDFVKRIMPQHAGHVVDIDGIKTPIAAANWLYDQGYRKLHMVVGEDRVAAMTDLMTGWNSDAVREKDGREPVQISVVSAGDRDPDSEGLSGISGTKARAAVSDEDRAAFEKATGLKGALANKLYDAVSAGMVKKPVKEQIWSKIKGMMGAKEPPAADDRDPPVTSDLNQLAAWVKRRVKSVKSQGIDPAYLLYVRNLESVWAPLIARLNPQQIDQLRNILSQDPELARLMNRAPFVDHPSNLEEAEHHERDGVIVTLRLSHRSAQRLYTWCHEHNIPCISPQHLHLTVLFSEVPVPELLKLHDTSTHVKARIKGWKKLGQDALTLLVHSNHAVRLHNRLIDMGGSHSWPDFLPHVTVVYGWSNGLPTELPDFDLVFDRIHTDKIDPNYTRRVS